MIHNGIEYGLMQSYAEGSTSCVMRPPARCRKNIGTTWIWQRLPNSGGAAASSARGCSISRALALAADPQLAQFVGKVADSGEGRWTFMRPSKKKYLPTC
jgi:6-phosphogluconate dehydrogenase